MFSIGEDNKRDKDDDNKIKERTRAADILPGFINSGPRQCVKASTWYRLHWEGKLIKTKQFQPHLDFMEKEHFTQSSVIDSYFCICISPVGLCRVYIHTYIHSNRHPWHRWPLSRCGSHWYPWWPMITINKTLAWTPGPVIHLALVVQQPAERMKKARNQLEYRAPLRKPVAEEGRYTFR